MSAEGDDDSGEVHMLVDEEEDDGAQHMDTGDDASNAAGPPQVWDPSRYKLDEDEELDYDRTAYKTMHELNMEWPCLSFDLMPDALGAMRTTWPQSLSLVAGSQAAEPAANRISVMLISNVTETDHKPDDEEDDDDDEQDDSLQPVVLARFIKQRAAINRIRAMPQSATMVAAWSEDGSVSVHNVAPLLRALEDTSKPHDQMPIDWKPVALFTGHSIEGYAMAWSNVVEGLLVTGDNAGKIHLWEPEMMGTMRNWKVDSDAFGGHTGSVEDLVWSPSEARVFASASSDHTVKLWDCRAPAKAAVLTVSGHQDDVNVLSWNAMVTHLIASGCDDGVWKVHDLRMATQGAGTDVFSFGFHKEPITSIEWCPFEDSMVAVASSDDSITVWDLSATVDDDQPPEPLDDAFLETVPEQLLFLHRGLFDPKELHWHKQVPGMIVATAANGLHIFAAENIVPK